MGPQNGVARRVAPLHDQAVQVEVLGHGLLDLDGQVVHGVVLDLRAARPGEGLLHLLHPALEGLELELLRPDHHGLVL